MIVIIIIIAVIIVQAVIWNFAINPNLVRREAVRLFPGLDESIAFDKSSYEPNTVAKITVFDLSANTNPATREKITVQVYSDSDSVGIPVQLEEYRIDSAKFVTHPYLVKLTTQSSNPSINALHIKSGDKIYAKYVDHTATASITQPPYIPNPPDENTVVGGGGLNLTNSNTSPSVLTNTFSESGTLSTTGVSISANPIPVFGCYDDMDLDGICDEWEDVGNLSIPYGTSGATYQVPCNASNTDPTTDPSDPCPGSDKQDIYVQASYMQIPGVISQAITPDAIHDLKKVFWDHHIRLHFLLDSQSIQYYNDLIDVPGNPTDPPGTHSYFGIKNAYFGSPEERTCQFPNDPTTTGIPLCSDSLPGMLTAKSQVFHYALFIHGQAARPGSSGWAEIFGNDIVISMGAFKNGVGDENQTAGTFMHELGHNLDLSHGGAPADIQNCEPNYISAMNYLRQFQYFVPTWRLDYSNTTFSLNELSLDESKGIGVQPPGVTAYSYIDVNGAYQPANGPASNGTIDWNHNGKIESSPLTTPLEIQYFGIPTCGETNKETLNGFNDWGIDPLHLNGINLAFQTSDNFANGAEFTPNSEREMTRGDVDTLFMKEYGINSTGKDLGELYKNIQQKYVPKIKAVFNK